MADVGTITDSFSTTTRVSNVDEAITRDFKNEKELCDYIDLYPSIFAKDVLEIDYLGHEREYCISGDRRMNKNWKARVDFKFTGPNGDIYVECKNPIHSYSEAHTGLGQILGYNCLAELFNRKVERYVLVTTKYNPILKMVIGKFNLPIEVYIISKQRVAKMLFID